MAYIEDRIDCLEDSMHNLQDGLCEMEEKHNALLDGVGEIFNRLRLMEEKVDGDEPQVQQTTEEFVRVVRCKNCVWYVNVPDSQISDRCKNEDGLYDPKPDDYCMYGEKRENEKAH